MATNEELVVQFRAETDQMRREMAAMQRQMNEFTSITRQSSREYRRSIENMGDSNSEYSRRLRELKRQQREAMKPHIEELKRTKLAYLDAAMSMGTYTGSVQDLISQVNAVGKAEKSANDAMMKNDRMMQASILQTIGMMNNMSTTSSKLRDNLRTMGNPLYNLSHGALMATNAIERLANRSSAAQLALEFLGPNANAKQLNDQVMLINQGLMRMQMVAIAASVACAALYGSLHKANMEMNPKYAKAYNEMIEKLSEAFKPMKEAFAAMMIPIYKFITALAEMIIKFNEAHPTMAKFIQGALMLVPALTLILSPLAVGIGLFLGYRAAIAAVWMLIKPLVLGLAMVSPVAWAVAAAISGLVVGFMYAYKHIEPFRNAVNKTVKTIKVFGQALVDLSKYLFWTAVDGDYLNDWITHLPVGFQNAAQRLGESVAMIREKILSTMEIVMKFGETIAALGKYLFWTAVDGDYLNDWITHLPLGFQNAAELLGRAIASIREHISQLVEAVRLALGGDTSQLGQIFMTIIPTLISFLLGGLPALLITAARFLPTIVEGMNTMLPMLTQAITNIIISVVTLITTYLPQFLTKGIEILTKVIEGIVQVLPTVVTTIVDVVTTMINTWVNTIGVLLPLILDAGIKILMAIIDGIVQALPAIIDACITVIDKLVQSLVSLLPLIIDAGIKILMALIEGIVKILPNLIDTAIMLITKLCDMLIKMLPQLLDAGMKILLALIEGIVTILPDLIQAAIKIIVALVNTLMENMPKIWKMGMTILFELIKGIIKILPQLIQTAIMLIVEIVRVLMDNMPKIWKAGMQILKELILGILSMVGELLYTIWTNVVDGIYNCFKDSWKWLKSAGENIVIGLINGITGMVTDAINAAWEVGNDIYKTIIGFFDIHSPSRLMRGVGEYVIMGMIKGLNNMENPAVKAAKDVATSVRDAFDVLSDDVSLGNVAFAGSIPDVSTSYSAPASVSSTTSSSFGQQAMVNSQSPNGSNQGDNSLVASAIAGLRKDLTNLQVVMEGETVGRIVRPHVNEGNAVENTVRRYF